MRQFYLVFKNENWSTLWTKLTWSHLRELLSIEGINKINYYINICANKNISVRELRERIKSKEYERLPESTKNKLIVKEDTNIKDFVKNPIVINTSKEIISEKVLKQLILENLRNFLYELGAGFAFIDSEYKIKIGNQYNYIDLLLFNIKYNCYVVIELKVTELKAEHIGQIKKYIGYIDKNLKTIYQEKTIGIIIFKKIISLLWSIVQMKKYYLGNILHYKRSIINTSLKIDLYKNFYI